MRVSVYNTKGEDTGRKADLKKPFFGIEPNGHVIYMAVKQHLAARRRGTSKTKERAEITGSTKKIKRQKGTGTARAGDIKSPIFRGGGRTFGPKPRDYGFKLNKKVKKLARLSALSIKAKEKNITVLEDFNFEKPATGALYDIFKNLNIEDKKCLLVLSEPNKNIYLSSRNLPGSEVITISGLNVYNVMKSTALIFTETALKSLQKK